MVSQHLIQGIKFLLQHYLLKKKSEERGEREERDISEKVSRKERNYYKNLAHSRSTLLLVEVYCRQQRVLK